MSPSAALIDVEALRKARRDKGMGNMLMRSRFEMYRDYYGKAEFLSRQRPRGRGVRDLPRTHPLQEQALANMTRAGVLG